MPRILGNASPLGKLKSILFWVFIAAIIGGMFSFTARIINSSESRLFPAGTKIHEGFPWRNGDHMYYVSEALQISGLPYQEALIETTQEFSDWPGKPEDLNLGYLSMDFAPLVYPRFTLPLVLSWGYQIAGFAGMFAMPVLTFLLTFSLLVNWVSRNFGNQTGIATAFAGVSSVLFLKYGAGLFVESLVLLIEAIWLYLLPITKLRLGKATSLIIFNLSVVLLSVTRQMPFLPLAVLFVGFLFSTYREKTFRNEWLIFAASGSLTTVVMYVFVAMWAPYNPLPYLVSLYGAPTGLGIIPWSANHFLDSLFVTAKNLPGKDPAMLLLIPLGIYGGWKNKESALPWIALSTWFASAVTIVLNVPEYRFWAPAIVFSLPLVGLGFLHLFQKISNRNNSLRRAGGVLRSSNKWADKFALSFICIFLITFAATSQALINYYGSENEKYVTEFKTPTGWQDSNSIKLGGTISCFGDNAQLVLNSNSGKSLLLTGTAKARTLKSHSLEIYNETNNQVGYSDFQPFIDKCLYLVRQD